MQQLVDNALAKLLNCLHLLLAHAVAQPAEGFLKLSSTDGLSLRTQRLDSGHSLKAVTPRLKRALLLPVAHHKARTAGA